jgi:hypothetical protein
VLWWLSACVGVDCDDGMTVAVWLQGCVSVWELLCCEPPARPPEGVLLTGGCCFFFSAS